MFASNRDVKPSKLLKITFIILIGKIGIIIGNRITETIQFSSKLYIYKFRDSFNWQFCCTTNLDRGFTVWRKHLSVSAITWVNNYQSVNILSPKSTTCLMYHISRHNSFFCIMKKQNNKNFDSSFNEILLSRNLIKFGTLQSSRIVLFQQTTPFLLFNFSNRTEITISFDHF